ncbi:hypothetical protein ACP70R_010445 [Stipagrostis hirtigluma subsp. patula]
MGLLLLNRLMSMQRERKRRRQIQARNGSIASVTTKRHLLCREYDHSLGGKRSRYSGPTLPEDIWCHIHSLMPLRDAARAACVSRTFLSSWRRYPKLTFTKKSLGLKRNTCRKGDIARDFTTKVDHILKHHSGIGLKTFRLEIHDYGNINGYLNSWLRIAITPGIEVVELLLPSCYNFPCSLLFGGRGNSIRNIYLTDCAFRPTNGFDCLRSLTELHLYQVRITGDELGCILSSSFALEQLELRNCNELIYLKIPSCLEQLRFLRVFECEMLQMIESKAPNLSTFCFSGDPVEFLLGESSQLKNLDVEFLINPISYAITNLSSIVTHLETLTIYSISESVDTPIVANKFFHLKYLDIDLTGCEAFSPAYDYLSLVSFLDASPVLESFVLGVNQGDMKHESVFEYASPSHMRQIPEHKHDRLKNVEVIGFCSAKSMVELICYILQNATSLESLTVDTIFDENDENIGRCSVRKTGKCTPITRHMILEAHKALKAIKRYILGKVPSTVKLNVGEPCSRCHAIEH